MTGRTDGERLINGWWYWGDDKVTLIAVRLASTASEWTHIPYLICQAAVCQLCSKGLAKCFVSVSKIKRNKICSFLWKKNVNSIKIIIATLIKMVLDVFKQLFAT